MKIKKNTTTLFSFQNRKGEEVPYLEVECDHFYFNGEKIEYAQFAYDRMREFLDEVVEMQTERLKRDGEAIPYREPEDFKLGNTKGNYRILTITEGKFIYREQEIEDKYNLYQLINEWERQKKYRYKK